MSQSLSVNRGCYYIEPPFLIPHAAEVGNQLRDLELSRWLNNRTYRVKALLYCLL